MKRLVGVDNQPDNGTIEEGAMMPLRVYGFQNQQNLETRELSGRWEIPMQLEKDDIKLIEDKLALIESNIRAIREYLDERTMEIQELSDDIMKIVRKG